MGKDQSDQFGVVDECKRALLTAKGVKKGEVYAQMGDAYRKMDKASKAIVCYREAMEAGVEDISFFEKFAQLLANKGDLDLAGQVIDKGLEKAGAPMERARLFKTMAYIKRNGGFYQDTKELGLKAIEIIEKILDPGIEAKRILADSRNIVAIGNWEMGDYDECLRFFEGALRAYKEIQDFAGMARMRNNLGYLNFQIGNPVIALRYFDQAIEAENEADTPLGGGTVYNNIGLVCVTQGKYDLAEQNFKECIKISKKSGYLYSVPLAQMNLADMFIEKGEIIKAKTWTELALKGFQNLNERPRVAQVLCTKATIAVLEGELEAAARLAEEAYRIGHDHKAHEAINLANRVMGMVKAAEGDFMTAEKLFRSAIEAHRKARDSWALALTLKELAKALKAKGDDDGSMKIAAEARNVFSQLGSVVELKYMDELGL